MVSHEELVDCKLKFCVVKKVVMMVGDPKFSSGCLNRYIKPRDFFYMYFKNEA